MTPEASHARSPVSRPRLGLGRAGDASVCVTRTRALLDLENQLWWRTGQRVGRTNRAARGSRRGPRSHGALVVGRCRAPRKARAHHDAQHCFDTQHFRSCLSRHLMCWLRLLRPPVLRSSSFPLPGNAFRLLSDTPATRSCGCTCHPRHPDHVLHLQRARCALRAPRGN